MSLSEAESWFDRIRAVLSGIRYGGVARQGIYVSAVCVTVAIAGAGLAGRVPWAALLVGEAALLATAARFLRRAIRHLVPPVPGGAAWTVQGLSAFGPEDAELYGHLQRQRTLVDCRRAVLASQFRLGVVWGPSGCGKTSFLRAGLIPALAKQEPTRRIVYVACSTDDPIEAIRRELMVAGAIERRASGDDLASVLAAPRNSPCLLVLDQFEQAITQPGWRTFSEDLGRWYETGARESAGVLIAVRSDYVGDLLGALYPVWHQTPENGFFLDNFSIAQATTILVTLAHKSGIDVDVKFAERVAEQLASPDRVSPIHLQILLFVIDSERAEGSPAGRVTPEALQRLGGIDGLLSNYIGVQLRQVSPQFRDRVRRVLRSLVPDEARVEGAVAAAVSLESLLPRLPTPDRGQAAEVLDWVSHPNVRLAIREGSQDAPTYRLAHDRLIPAVRRLAAEFVDDAELASRILRDRLPLWLRDHQAAYLPSIKEYRLVRRHLATLAASGGARAGEWRVPHAEVEKYLGAVQRRWRLRGAGALAALAIGTAGWFWAASPNALAWRATDLLATLSDGSGDTELLREIVIMHAMQGRSGRAVAIATRVPLGEDRQTILAALGATLLQMGGRVGPLDTRRVTELAGTLQPPDRDALRRGAVGFLVASTPAPDRRAAAERVIELIKGMEGADARERALEEAASFIAGSADGLALLRGIRDPGRRVMVLLNAATRRDATDVGERVAEACGVPREVANLGERAALYERVVPLVVGVAKREDLHDRIVPRCVEVFEPPLAKVLLLARLAETGEEPERVSAWFEQAIAVASGLSYPDHDQALVALAEVAVVVALKTKWQAAADLARRVNARVKDPRARYFAFLAQAEIASQLGDLLEARRCIASAGTLADFSTSYRPVPQHKELGAFVAAAEHARCIDCLVRFHPAANGGAEPDYGFVSAIVNIVKASGDAETLKRGLDAVRALPGATEVHVYRVLSGALAIDAVALEAAGVARVVAEARRFQTTRFKAALLVACAERTARRGTDQDPAALFDEALAAVSARVSVSTLKLGRYYYDGESTEVRDLAENTVRLWQVRREFDPIHRLMVATASDQGTLGQVTTVVGRLLPKMCDLDPARQVIEMARRYPGRVPVSSLYEVVDGALGVTEQCNRADLLDEIIPWVSLLEANWRQRLYDRVVRADVARARARGSLPQMAVAIAGMTTSPLSSIEAVAARALEARASAELEQAIRAAVAHAESRGEGQSDGTALVYLIDKAITWGDWSAAWRLANSPGTTDRRAFRVAHFLVRYTQAGTSAAAAVSHMH